MEYTIHNEDGSKTIYSFNSVDSRYIDNYIRGFQPTVVKQVGAKGDRKVLTASVVNATRPVDYADSIARKMLHLA